MNGADGREEGEPRCEPSSSEADALVVLGCKLRLDAAGRLRRGVLRQRVEAGARAYANHCGARTVVVASGGRRWGGLVEADVIAEELSIRGIPERAIVRERRSRTTRQNALFVTAMLCSYRLEVTVVVTSDWHLPRALALFGRAGLVAQGIGAGDPEGTASMNCLWQRGRERVLRWAQTR